MTSPSYGQCLGLFLAAAFLFLVADKTQAQTHYEIVILAGQSNAVGAAGATDLRQLPSDRQAPQEDVLFYSNGGGSLAGPTDLQPGSGTGDYGFGPEVAFGRAIADARPDANFAIVKHASSATDLAFQWAPNTGSVYNSFLNTVNRATNNITSNGDTFEITGFLWVQGEADANRQFGSAYNANLTNFIAAVRSRFGADLPFHIVLLSDNQVYAASAEDDLIRQAQQDVAAADDNAFLLNTNGPEFEINGPPDNLHYTTVGQVVLGEALAEAFLGSTVTPPPLPPAESERIVLVEAFADPAAGGLNGSSAVVDSAVTGAGGSSTWNAAANYLADGSVDFSMANTCATLDIGDVINNAKGTPDGLFELRVTVEQPTRAVGDTRQTWYSIGFSQLSAPDTSQHWIQRQGLATVMYHDRGEYDLWAGNGFTPNGQSPAGNANPHTPIPATENVTGTRTIIVEIDVRESDGVSNFGTVTYFDTEVEDPLFTFNYSTVPVNGSIPTDPDFASIMISEANSAMGTYSNLTLTQFITGATGVTGDFDGNEVVDCDDIDFFSENLGMPAATLSDFDLVTDGMIDSADVEFLIETLVVTSNGQTGTFLGDLNCDGQVDVLNDAFILISSLGLSVDRYSLGDIDLDGIVSVLGDAFALVGNLGMSNIP